MGYGKNRRTKYIENEREISAKRNEGGEREQESSGQNEREENKRRNNKELGQEDRGTGGGNESGERRSKFGFGVVQIPQDRLCQIFSPSGFMVGLGKR